MQRGDFHVFIYWVFNKWLLLCNLYSETHESFFSYPAKLAPPINNNGTDYDYDGEYYEDYEYEPYDEIQANSTGN